MDAHTISITRRAATCEAKRLCGSVAKTVAEPHELIELHEPAAVRVVLREDPGRLGRRHVDSEGVQAVAQLAVVEPACSRLGQGVRAGLG